MIIDDLLASNANALMSELKVKRGKLIAVHESAQPGSDFRETVEAQLTIVTAALNAVNREYHRYITPRPDNFDDLPWGEKVAHATREKGSDLTLEELLILAKNHTMSDEEIAAQRKSWARQDMD